MQHRAAIFSHIQPYLLYCHNLSHTIWTCHNHQDEASESGEFGPQPRLSLGFYYSNERSFLHRELTEMIYWALMYAWCHGSHGNGCAKLWWSQNGWQFGDHLRYVLHVQIWMDHDGSSYHHIWLRRNYFIWSWNMDIPDPALEVGTKAIVTSEGK